MNKIFCDLCNDEIVGPNNVSFSGDSFRLKAILGEQNSSKLVVEVVTSSDNKGDFCKYCVLDALYKLNDRPKPVKQWSAKK